MDLQDANSPTYSVSSNLLRLNSTSLHLSTPGPIGDMVSFEEFAQPQPTPQNNQNQPSHPAFANKKRLTIEINEEFEEESPIKPPSHHTHSSIAIE